MKYLYSAILRAGVLECLYVAPTYNNVFFCEIKFFENSKIVKFTKIKRRKNFLLYSSFGISESKRITKICCATKVIRNTVQGQ